MAVERTFVMIKPDGIQRRLLGEVIARFERKGLKMLALKMMKIDRRLAEKHYEVHKGKPFYKGLIEFITSGPVAATVWSGEAGISIVRKVVGATSPAKAEPGTIRGDFAISTGFNIIHASDAPETAQREIDLFFLPEEILDYDLTIEAWLVQEEDS
jgi:nucleoside-diphosphate kinase